MPVGPAQDGLLSPEALSSLQYPEWYEHSKEELFANAESLCTGVAAAPRLVALSSRSREHKSRGFQGTDVVEAVEMWAIA